MPSPSPVNWWTLSPSPATRGRSVISCTANFSGRGFQAEKIPAEGAALQCARDFPRSGTAHGGFLHPYGHGPAFHSLFGRRQPGLWTRLMRRQGNYCRAGCRGRTIAAGRHPCGTAFSGGRGTRQPGRQSGQPAAVGIQVSGQRRTHREPGRGCIQGRVAGRADRARTMAHSAYPELGESAIDKLLEALQRLRAMKLPAKRIGPCTLNIGVIEGGRAPM